ncbi:Nucleotide-binding protein, UspA family [Halanaeroarchaeum sp. HSR-CO]|uniref:universal stress protein n=1 Tax=Halanaeroarchaeum sp. HSR-CO TaxID=2866382 RepID=UPI00217EB880|nr:universal stress protein [Halanaeroarchaeum sp. HSR-CO]UWG48703.1 Nucleotide-binding protein, UspA family [Halanaeroarchaeum sp. HSR-CO]
MTDRPTILLPIRVLEGESIPEGVPELLATAHVVLLGYHVVPEQTATDQARLQFEERATNRMDQFEEMLTDAGATVERRLVFTHEAQATIDRTIYEHDCLAVLVPQATGPPDDVLVAVRGTVGVDRLVRLVSGLFADTDTSLTLFHVLDESESEADARTLLDGIADRLDANGFDADRLDVRVADSAGPMNAIVDVANEFDAVVMGESDPSVVTFVFGMRSEQVADQFLGPVLVIQRARPDAESESNETAASGSGSRE